MDEQTKPQPPAANIDDELSRGMGERRKKGGKKSMKRGSSGYGSESRILPSRKQAPPLSDARADLEIPISTASREQVSELTMLASIRGGAFEDVKFYTFSRRTNDGDVDTPIALFGNSALIRKASTHFDFVFTQGFAESGITDLDAPFPSNRASRITLEEYCYASDSDLEDERDDDDADIYGSMKRMSVGSSSRRGQGAAEPENAQRTDEEEISRPEPVVYPSSSLRPGRMGRVVFLEDIAYRTWQAFVFYAYFDKITFSPLKSQEQADAKPTGPFDPPTCSPKSMYRLAEKYGIEALKQKAADDIKSKLSTENILTEIFSSFTLTHPEIQKMEVDFLFNRVREPALVSRLPKWFQYLENGELHPGAGVVFSTLVDKLITGGIKKCPRNCNSSFKCAGCNQYV